MGAEQKGIMSVRTSEVEAVQNCGLINCRSVKLKATMSIDLLLKKVSLGSGFSMSAPWCGAMLPPSRS